LKRHLPEERASSQVELPQDDDGPHLEFDLVIASTAHVLYDLELGRFVIEISSNVALVVLIAKIYTD
jgi:hypothetical protein